MLAASLNKHTTKLSSESLSSMQTIKYALSGKQLILAVPKAETMNKSLTINMRLAHKRKKNDLIKKRAEKELKEKRLALAKKVSKAESRRITQERVAKEVKRHAKRQRHCALADLAARKKRRTDS